MNLAHTRILLTLFIGLIAASAASATPLDPTGLRGLVERQAAVAARASVAPPDRLEVLSVKFTGADPLIEGVSGIELVEGDGPNASGFLRLVFRLLRDGVPVGTARATVRGVVFGPALVARQTLIHGKPIDRRTVELIETDLTRLGVEPLRDLAELTDRVPVRTLGVGRTLTRQLLRAEPVVRRGQTVDLTIERPGFTVTTKGSVRRDGAPGETIPAQNLSTGAQVVGLVRHDGSLLVVQPAVRSSR
jgi:flagella basal body P-ring formation protein FlgA